VHCLYFVGANGFCLYQCLKVQFPGFRGVHVLPTVFSGFTLRLADAPHTVTTEYPGPTEQVN